MGFIEGRRERRAEGKQVRVSVQAKQGSSAIMSGLGQISWREVVT